jgi:hypothetical protein
VFVDETTTSTNMAGQHGCCKCRERLMRQILKSQWKGLTCAVDLLHDEMAAPFEIDAPKDGASFLTYREQCRVPPLKRGEFLSSIISRPIPSPMCAKVSERQMRCCVMGCDLPRFSPDIDPNVLAVAKFKALP